MAIGAKTHLASVSMARDEVEREVRDDIITGDPNAPVPKRMGEGEVLNQGMMPLQSA